MTRTHSALLGALLGAVVATSATGELQPWHADGILQDPVWKRHFLGSYGFLSGVEPEIAPRERELLGEVIELMKTNPSAAVIRLKGEVGAGTSAAIDFILANLEFQTGELEPAITHYRSALEKFPDFRRAHKNLGLVMVQRHEYPGALEHLSRAVELGDRDARNFGLMGYCYVQVENYLAAEVAYRNAILQDPETRDWMDGLARSLLAMKKFQEAAALFGSLIAQDPDEVAPWLLQANAFIGLDQQEDAAANLEAVRLLGKADVRSLVLLGDIYMNAGSTGLALDAYVEAIAKDDDATQFRAAQRAVELLIRVGANVEAKKMLASIDERYSKHVSDEDSLGILTLEAKLARVEGNETRAAELLESIVRRDGTRGDALLELAHHYRDRGDTERALMQIERAQKLSDYRYPALLEHAQLRASSREYARAAELLRAALEIKREARVERFLAQVEQASRP